MFNRAAKTIRRPLGWLLALALLLAMAAPALAYTPTSGGVAPAPAYIVTSSPAQAVISYESIPAMVDRNLELQQAKNTANSTYGSQSDLIDQLKEAESTANEYAETYRNAREEIESWHEAGIIGDNERDMLLEAARTLYETVQSSTQSTITSLRQGINSAQYAELNASLAVVSTRQQQINTAQQSFFNYYSLRYKKIAAESQLSNLEFQVSLAKIKLERNLMSQVAYEQLENSLPSAVLAIESINSALRQNELALKSALGLSASTAIEYGPQPDMDLSAIPARSRDADRQVYLARNSVIEQARLGIEKANVDLATDVTDTLYDQRGAVLTYEQAVESATRQFESAYDSMQDNYKSYLTAQKAHKELEKELARLEKKYKGGTTSKNSVRNKSDEVTQSKNSLTAQKIDLYSQYQTYLNGLTL